MARIIAGMFDTITKAEAAVQSLVHEKCRREDVSTFHNNAPGQHGTFPLGGDEDADPGAKEAQTHAAAGAAVGAGLGLAAAIAGPFAAVAAAGVGAYTGSLSGALTGVGNKNMVPTRRPAGVMVAVNVNPVVEENVVEILRANGASEVEVAEGEWQDGQWIDFNPIAVPQILPDSNSLANSAVFRVLAGGKGQWLVFESGFDKPLSLFQLREDAVKYAASLAQTKPHAVVEIYNEEGELDKKRAYSLPSNI